MSRPSLAEGDESEPLPIAVLSLNPAVDMTYEVARLIPDQKAHAVATRFDPGGNGINVGRALKRLETFAYSYCVVAGEIGQLLKHLLRQQLDWVDYEEVEGETRINGTAIEQHPRAQYEISGIGPAIPPPRLESVLNRFEQRAGNGFGVLTGSTQNGVPPTLYGELVRRITERGGRAIVDSHDEALRRAIEAQPFLIKPNRYELETLLGRPLKDTETVAAEARKLQQGGVTWICVSLGEEGALLTGPDNSYFAPAPKVTVYSSVGAGDSMVGALVAAFSRGISAREGLRLGVACATGTVTHPGTELFSPDDVQCYFDDIQVRSLDI